MKYPKLTHDQHVELAKKVRAADALLGEVFDTVNKAFPKNSRVVNSAWRFVSQSGYMSALKSALDTEYHRVTTDEQFYKRGHVYYTDDALTKE